MTQPEERQEGQIARAIWFRRGAVRIVSAPALILLAIFVGYAVLARESGIALGPMAFIGALVWAMPSQVLLVGAIAADASLLATALAVSLASIRFLPMTVTMIPVIRDETTPRWQLLLISHFSAITGWVFAMTYAPKVPRYARVAYVAGFSIALVCSACVVAVISYLLVDHLPIWLAGCLVFLTPIYFVCSITGSSKFLSDYLAMAFGLCLGPVLIIWQPDFGLLWSGLIGGTLAYMIGRWSRIGKAKS